MASCPTFPVGDVRDMIEQTEETGREHAIVKCGDGSTSDVIEGGYSSTNIGEEIEACDLNDGDIDVIHTHPNGVTDLSKQDREVAASEHVDHVCAANTDGEIHCERVESCEREVRA